MRVLVMDYFRQFDGETIARLGDAGVRDILLFGLWSDFEPIEGQYPIDEYLAYLRHARAAGIRVLTISSGGPTWAPDDWHLKNLHGQRNECRDYLAAEKIAPTRHYTLGAGYAGSSTFLSYWHPEAEFVTRRHIAYLRGVTEAEGSDLMPWIGGGEYFFPAPQFIPSRPWIEGEWWHDPHATASWLRYLDEADSFSPLSRADWVYREQLRVTRARLALYRENWLQLVPGAYHRNPRLGSQETIDLLAAASLDANGAPYVPPLQTILFSVFCGLGWEPIAEAQARRHPTWMGVEGAYHLRANAPKAEAMGAAGVVCGPLWPHYGLTAIEPWVYDAIRQTVGG